MEKTHKILLTVLLAWLAPLVASAATLYVTPAKGSYGIGGTFSVSVYVSSSDQAMNAAAGTVAFSRDKLEVTGLSKGGSVFSFWVQEPSYSNATGRVNFEGIVLNPGYKGAAGKLLTITFKTKAAGTATANFSSASVLANDGQGTNILKGTGGATYSINAATPVPPAPAPAPSVSVPKAPLVSSSTHPNPDAWYATKDARFSWPVPSGATAVRLLIGGIPDSSPIVEYSPPVGSKEVTDLADGTWYFHVQLGNAGGWGSLAHFRLRIDTEKPSRLRLVEVPRIDSTEPKATFVLEAVDSLSGISHYGVSIDGGAAESWKDDGSHQYVTAEMTPGKHTLAATAFDRAGNSLSANTDFFIAAPELPPVTAPTAPESVATAAETTIAATTAAETTAAETTAAKTTTAGTLVRTPSTTAMAAFILAALVALITLVALIALGLVVPFAKRREASLRRRVGKEAREAGTALHLTFDALWKDLGDRLGSREKARGGRSLIKEDDELLKQLKTELDAAESVVRKEIEDIEKEVK